jgi:hypothetical protein
MGVGDLKQPCLRTTSPQLTGPSSKFRYWDGRFVNSVRGHRVTWAIFNATLLEASRVKGDAYFKATEASALTKADLRTLIEEKDGLGAGDCDVWIRDSHDADVLEEADDAIRVDSPANVMGACRGRLRRCGTRRVHAATKPVRARARRCRWRPRGPCRSSGVRRPQASCATTTWVTVEFLPFGSR